MEDLVEDGDAASGIPQEEMPVRQTSSSRSRQLPRRLIEHVNDTSATGRGIFCRVKVYHASSFISIGPFGPPIFQEGNSSVSCAQNVWPPGFPSVQWNNSSQPANASFLRQPNAVTGIHQQHNSNCSSHNQPRAVL